MREALPLCNNHARRRNYFQMLSVDDPPSAVADIYFRRFERCVRDHYAQVLAFSMRRVAGPEIAEDVTVDTFALAGAGATASPTPSCPGSTQSPAM